MMEQGKDEFQINNNDPVWLKTLNLDFEKIKRDSKNEEEKQFQMISQNDVNIKKSNEILTLAKCIRQNQEISHNESLISMVKSF